MAQELRGKPVADALGETTARCIQELRDAGVVPALAIVRVGEREDDLSYERAADKRCAALGIEVRKFLLPADCTQEELFSVLSQVNADESIHGCLLFRPLPAHLDERAACAALDPAKDVDGITAGSLYGVFADEPTGFAPCTAEACVRLLQHYEVPLSGAHVAVAGRSLVIGRPVASLLTAQDATVTLCHSRTRSLDEVLQGADIIVAAVGRAGTVGAEALRPGQVIVDVGMNWSDELGKFVGDVDYSAAADVVSAVTPVPGGVGSVTTAVLAYHVVQAAKRACALNEQ